MAEPRVQPQLTTQTTMVGEPTHIKVKRFFRKIYKIISSTFGLIVVLIIYSFIGAAIFHGIEGRHEVEEKAEVIDMRNAVMHNAWNLSQVYGETEEDFKAQISEELHRYELKLHDAFTHGVNSDSETKVWDFWGAFLFCATVYSTIGYGHIAPATNAGKVMTMIYALFGIPLCLIVMADLGKKLTIGIKFLWSFVRRFYYTGRCKKIRKTIPTKAIKETLGKPTKAIKEGLEKPTKAIKEGLDKLDFLKKSGSEATLSAASTHKEEEEEEEEEEDPTQFQVDDEFNLPPIIAVAITVIYILVGAAMYKEWEENWSYLDAFYFIFISVSTVGFGDILPEHPRYFLASSIYILLGLSLVAMVITVFMEVVGDTIDKAKNKVINVGQKIGINLSTEEVEMAGRDKKDNGDPPQQDRQSQTSKAE